MRTPSSLRGAAAWPRAGWRALAKRKPRRASRRARSITGTGASMSTPRARRTSALPERELTEWFPCLATFAPAAAARIAAVVEMLKVPAPSPPVPAVSTTGPGPGSTRVTFARRVRTAPVTSSMVSPFIRRAMAKPATWAGVARPDMMSSMAEAASTSERLWPSTTREMARRICSDMGRL